MQAPPLQLRPGIGVARFADCGIVLDTVRDRYWQVEPSTAFSLDWLLGRSTGPVAPADLERLAKLGFTEERALPRSAASVMLPDPQTSPLDQRVDEDFSVSLIAGVLWHAIRGTLSVRTIRLARLIAAIERRRSSIADEAAGDLISLARAYARYRPLLPIAPRCLADSIAFMALANSYGHRPALVFGVIAHPFAAHCWVQSGGDVLTDRLDHVRTFTPILTI